MACQKVFSTKLLLEEKGHPFADTLNLLLGETKKWPLASQQPEQAHGVPRVDCSHVLSGKTGRVDVRYRRLDRVRGSKRHVGAEEHVSRSEELEDTAHRVWRAEE